MRAVEILHTAVHGRHNIAVRRLASSDGSAASKYLYQLLIDGVNRLSVPSNDAALIYALAQFVNVIDRDSPARAGEPESV